MGGGARIAADPTQAAPLSFQLERDVELFDGCANMDMKCVRSDGVFAGAAQLHQHKALLRLENHHARVIHQERRDAGREELFFLVAILDGEAVDGLDVREPELRIREEVCAFS